MGRWSRLVAPPPGGIRRLAGARPDARCRLRHGIIGVCYRWNTRATHTSWGSTRPGNTLLTRAAGICFPDRVGFAVGDAQQLEFPDASFDAILSSLAIHFIPDTKKALFRASSRNQLRVARSRLPFGIMAPGCACCERFGMPWSRIDREAGTVDENRMPLCREGELSALWRQVGLEDVHEQPIDITMRFDSFTDYWDPFLLGQGPDGAYVRRLEPDKLPILREEIKRRLSVSSEDYACRSLRAGVVSARHRSRPTLTSEFEKNSATCFNGSGVVRQS